MADATRAIPQLNGLEIAGAAIKVPAFFESPSSTAMAAAQ